MDNLFGFIDDSIRVEAIEFYNQVDAFCFVHNIDREKFLLEFEKKIKELPMSHLDFLRLIKYVFDSDFRQPIPDWLEEFCAPLLPKMKL